MNIQTTNNTTQNNDYEIQRYKGVAAVHVLAVNPDMATLNKYGYNLSEEPTYLKTYMTEDGKEQKMMNLRLLCAIDNLEDHPVISLYFRLRPEVQINKTGDKGRVIDGYGNNVWLDKEYIKSGTLPENIAKKMDSEYRGCHGGEGELIAFMHEYLGVPPFEKYNTTTNSYERNKNAGQIKFENWKKIFDGDISEIRDAFALQPDNLVYVILGVGTNDDNKQYQTFISDSSIYSIPFIPYWTNGTRVMARAKRVIEGYKKDGRHDNEEFSEEFVKEYNPKPTEVKAKNEDVNAIFPDDEVDDLPWKE